MSRVPGSRCSGEGGERRGPGWRGLNGRGGEVGEYRAKESQRLANEKRWSLENVVVVILV